MYNDIFTFAFAVFGIVAVMLYITFKLMVWRIDEFTIAIPLREYDKGIYTKIYNIRSFCDFCSLKNKCTIVLINYGAPDWFCDEIKDYYKGYDFLKIVSCNNPLETS